MTARHHIVPNTYKDSVTLMALSSKLLNLEGVHTASVVMATPSNLENLVEAGLGGDLSVKPTDLIVAVAGTVEACDEANAASEGFRTADFTGPAQEDGVRPNSP